MDASLPTWITLEDAVKVYVVSREHLDRGIVDGTLKHRSISYGGTTKHLVATASLEEAFFRQPVESIGGDVKALIADSIAHDAAVAAGEPTLKQKLAELAPNAAGKERKSWSIQDLRDIRNGVLGDFLSKAIEKIIDKGIVPAVSGAVAAVLLNPDEESQPAPPRPPLLSGSFDNGSAGGLWTSEIGMFTFPSRMEAPWSLAVTTSDIEHWKFDCKGAGHRQRSGQWTLRVSEGGRGRLSSTATILYNRSLLAGDFVLTIRDGVVVLALVGDPYRRFEGCNIRLRRPTK